MSSRLTEKLKTWASDTAWTIAAAFRSAVNLTIERYPEIERNGRLADLQSEKLVPELVKATAGYGAITGDEDDPVSVDDAIKLAQASLEESKKQTEYQDNKASRLLTVTSFVSALSGALLAAFADRYPLDQLNPQAQTCHLLLVAGYLAFLLFSLFALFGALVTFHATRTRFKYSRDAIVTDERADAKSMLFYKGIISTGPEGWAQSFVSIPPAAGAGQPNPAAAVRPDLKLIYLRHYVIEAYLVAAKTADKLRYLAAAQGLLAWAMRWLILFVVLFALSIYLVPKTRPAPRPTEVRVLPGSDPLPVRMTAPAAPPATATPPSARRVPPQPMREGAGR
jgi:hypothetical protein